MPLLSVIVPVYNTGKYLKRNVESILRQSFQDFELILVDDGSTDGCDKLCDEFALIDKRVKVIHKENGGVSSARNVGIKNSVGKWISFIDSDDWVEIDYLANFKLENLYADKSVILQGIVMDSRKQINFSNLFVYSDDFFEIENVKKVYDLDLFKDGCPVGKLFNRKVLVENNLYFDEKISLNEDHIFVLEYYLNIEYVYTRTGMKYHYVFDYTEPSLTKIKHGVDECIFASETIYGIFIALSNRLECEMCQISTRKTLRIFGFQQIIRAFRSASFNKTEFIDCCTQWEKHAFAKCDYADIYERFLSFLLGKKMFVFAMLWNGLNCFAKNKWLKIKRKIKKVANL